MGILFFVVALSLPIVTIVVIMRLLGRLTTRRSTRHGISLDAEEVKRDRVFRD